MSKIAVIGGGLSGLSFIYRLSQVMSSSSVKTFLLNKQMLYGGRARSVIVQDQHVDLGGNLIQFDSSQPNEFLAKKLFNNLGYKIKPFNKPFKLYENGQLKESKISKSRYYFEGGFINLINQILKRSVQNSNSPNRLIKFANYGEKVSRQVISIKQGQKNWKVTYIQKYCDSDDVGKYEMTFDNIVLAITPAELGKIEFKSEKLASEISEFQKQFQYTQQLSIAYRCKPQNDQLDFSQILFLNHPTLTFFSSHEEKYSNINKEIMLCVQLTPSFTQQVCKQNLQTISKRVYEQHLPKQLIKKYNIQPDFVCGKIWNPSLLEKSNNQQHQQKRYQCLKRLRKIGSQMGLWIVGDAVLGRSRASNALESGIRTAQQFLEKNKHLVKC